MLPYYDTETSMGMEVKDFRINHWMEPRDWPSHFHPQIEMIYIRHGALEVSIDSQTRVMRKGDFAVAFPHCIHSYTIVPGYEQDADVLFFIVNRHMAGDYADKMSAYVPQTPFVDSADLPEDVRIAVERLDRQEQSYHPSVAKAYVQIALACTWSLMRPRRDETRYQELPYQALKYVTEHFQQPITVESTARELCISKAHLSRLFSQKLHVPFHQYLNFMRMEMARDLLRNTDRSIITILYECGYESPRTFNRVFQEMCSMTPRQYRSRFQDE